MADTLEQLILALAQADSAVAGSDPYASPQAAVEGIRWDPSGFGVGENAAASGIKGLLSGLFGELGNDYKQRAASEYQNVLLSSALGKGPKVENKVLPEDLFAKVQNRATIFDTLKAKELQDADIAATKEAAKDKAKRAADLEDYESKLGIKERITGGGKGEKAPVIGAEMMGQIAKSKAVIDEAQLLANEIERIDPSWTDYTASKYLSGLDKEGVGLTLKNLADKLARARTGAAMNKDEVTLYQSLLGGDLTASPQQVSKLLRKLAAAEARMNQSQLQVYKKASNLDEAMSLFDIADVEPPQAQTIKQPQVSLDALLAEKARRTGGR